MSVTPRKFHGGPPLNPAQCRQHSDTKELTIISDPGSMSNNARTSRKGDPLGLDSKGKLSRKRLHWGSYCIWSGGRGSVQLTRQWEATGVTIPLVLDRSTFRILHPLKADVRPSRTLWRQFVIVYGMTIESTQVWMLRRVGTAGSDLKGRKQACDGRRVRELASCRRPN